MTACSNYLNGSGRCKRGECRACDIEYWRYEPGEEKKAGLKTLNDYETPECIDCCPGVCHGFKEYREWERKQAIKHIKNIRQLIEKEPIPSYKPLQNAVIDWIKGFFNITEEDLKEEKKDG